MGQGAWPGAELPMQEYSLTRGWNACLASVTDIQHCLAARTASLSSRQLCGSHMRPASVNEHPMHT